MLREDDESVCVEFFFLSHGAWAFTDSVSVHSILRTVSALLSFMSSYVISGGSADCGASHTLSVGWVSGYTQHQQVSVLLGTMPREPQVQHHKQWFTNIGDQGRDHGRPTESRFQCTAGEQGESFSWSRPPWP